jgi:NitT/TauT family transport system substrate-binding protein
MNFHSDQQTTARKTGGGGAPGAQTAALSFTEVSKHFARTDGSPLEVLRRFSVGFGAVLEVGKFLEKQGLAPEFVKFSDVNGPTKALITHSIDVDFAAPATGAFTLAKDGAPIDLVLATQVAETAFVAKEGSSVKTLADLKGKKVGMSPIGSATYAIAAAVLERNHGIKPSDFTPVPGNEGRLVQFLQQGDIDAASLRAVTLGAGRGHPVDSCGILGF